MSAATEYVVVAAGVSYRAAGEEPVDGRVPLGLDAGQVASAGRVITLDADEAERLTGLEAIRPATDADRKMDKWLATQEVERNRPPVVPDDNPYGGRPLYPEVNPPRQLLGVEQMIANANGGVRSPEYLKAELKRRRAARAQPSADDHAEAA